MLPLDPPVATPLATVIVPVVVFTPVPVDRSMVPLMPPEIAFADRIHTEPVADGLPPDTMCSGPPVPAALFAGPV